MGEYRSGRRPEGGAGLIELRPVDPFDPDLAPLLVASEAEGHALLRRLVNDWGDGTNRFDESGELFLGAWLDGRLAAVGGLNRDPYAADSRVGRVRHLYVLPGARRRGVGTTLLQRIVGEASAAFRVLRLRAATAEGGAFYMAHGFVAANDAHATHVLTLP